MGLDLHAGSIVACAIDGEVSELRSLRLSPKTDAVVEGVGSLPGPVEVTLMSRSDRFGLPERWRRRGAVCGGGAVEVGTSPGDGGNRQEARERDL